MSPASVVTLDKTFICLKPGYRDVLILAFYIIQPSQVTLFEPVTSVEMTHGCHEMTCHASVCVGMLLCVTESMI